MRWPFGETLVGSYLCLIAQAFSYQYRIAYLIKNQIFISHDDAAPRFSNSAFGN